MSNEKMKGLVLTGRMKQSGITVYLRNGKAVARTATSYQPKRRTRKQFVARQQLSHSSRLWKMLRWSGEPPFPAKPSAYACFLSLMHRTEVVFLPKSGRLTVPRFCCPICP